MNQNSTTKGPEPLDIACAGPLFVDVLFSPFASLAAPGEEVWTDSVQFRAGGAANVAHAAHALGMSATLVTELGTGEMSELAQRLCVRDGIALEGSVTFPGWDIPVSAAIAHEGERSFYTGGIPAPSPVTSLDAAPVRARALTCTLPLEEAPLLPTMAASGTAIFADVGFDDTGAWDTARLRHLTHCRAFTPNDLEACAYSGEDSALEAARALAEHVELVVVTRGARGLAWADSGTGASGEIPPFPVDGGNATGAGDTFLAAFVGALHTGAEPTLAMLTAQLVAAARVAGVAGPGTPGTRDSLAPFATRYRGRTPGVDLEAILETLARIPTPTPSSPQPRA